MKTNEKKSGRNTYSDRLKRPQGRLLIVPAGVVLILLTVIPIGYSLYVSMTDYNLTIPGSFEKFIGIRNYVEAFSSPDFRSAVWNTLEIAVPALFLEVLIGFVLALILNRRFFGRGLVIALLVTPYMIAPGAAALAWRLLFDTRYGPVNDLLSKLAGRSVVIDWLGSPAFAIRSLTLIDIWQTTPFVMLILLAGLSAISPEIYEAARIDGGSSLHTLRYVTLPLVRPILGTAVLFRSIDLLKMFDMCQALTKGGPAGTTMTLSFYTYRQGLAYSRVGYGAAISFVILIAVSLLSMLYIKNTMRGGNA